MAADDQVGDADAGFARAEEEERLVAQRAASAAARSAA